MSGKRYDYVSNLLESIHGMCIYSTTQGKRVMKMRMLGKSNAYLQYMGKAYYTYIKSSTIWNKKETPGFSCIRIKHCISELKENMSFF